MVTSLKSLASNTETTLIVVGIILLILMIFGISYYFKKELVILRKLKKIPLKRIGSLRTRQLEKIHGKALHVQEPLIAPLSKRKCVFYRIKLEVKKSNGKTTYWKTIIDDENIQTFFIEQNGNLAIVKPTQNPKNYKSFLVVDKKESSGKFNEPTPEFESLLRSYDINPKGWFGLNKSLRYTEGIIEIGEKITVAGIAKWNKLSEPIPEYSYSKIISLESGDNQPIIITDNPKAMYNNL